MGRCPNCNRENVTKDGIECYDCENRRLKKLVLREKQLRERTEATYRRIADRLEKMNSCDDCEMKISCKHWRFKMANGNWCPNWVSRWENERRREDKPR